MNEWWIVDLCKFKLHLKWVWEQCGLRKKIKQTKLCLWAEPESEKWFIDDGFYQNRKSRWRIYTVSTFLPRSCSSTINYSLTLASSGRRQLRRMFVTELRRRILLWNDAMRNGEGSNGKVEWFPLLVWTFWTHKIINHFQSVIRFCLGGGQTRPFQSNNDEKNRTWP